jgi:hypothetical protein
MLAQSAIVHQTLVLVLGALKQIDAGVLNIGYAEVGPTGNANCGKLAMTYDTIIAG